jgi:nitroreductase
MTKSPIEQINKIIEDRRSIYPPMFTGEKVTDVVIQQLLNNANFAPTHKRTEPWRFIVFSGQSLIQLSEYAAAWYKNNTDPRKYSEIKYEKTRKKALLSSHVIAIVMERHPELVPEWEEVASVACAVQNMWLTATALNLGAYWSSPQYAIQGKDFLGLSENQKCLGLFYIGIPQKHLQVSAAKNPIAEKVIWRK